MPSQECSCEDKPSGIICDFCRKQVAAENNVDVELIAPHLQYYTLTEDQENASLSNMTDAQLQHFIQQTYKKYLKACNIMESRKKMVSVENVRKWAEIKKTQKAEKSEQATLEENRKIEKRAKPMAAPKSKEDKIADKFKNIGLDYGEFKKELGL